MKRMGRSDAIPNSLCLRTRKLKEAISNATMNGKFTISFTAMRSYGEEITFTLGPAIPLTDLDCKLLPKS